MLNIVCSAYKSDLLEHPRFQRTDYRLTLLGDECDSLLFKLPRLGFVLAHFDGVI